MRKNLSHDRRRLKSGVISHESLLKPVPVFNSLEEEALFWDTHDTTDYALEDLEESIEVAGSLAARIEKRRIERIVDLLNLEPKQVQATQKIAQRRGMSIDTLIKIWIEEALRRELAKA